MVFLFVKRFSGVFAKFFLLTLASEKGGWLEVYE